jgi:hypothetical protein
MSRGKETNARGILEIFSKETPLSLRALAAALHCDIVARVVQDRLAHSNAVLPYIKCTSLIPADSPPHSTALADAVSSAQEIAHYQYDSRAIGGANMFGRQCSSLFSDPKH